MFSKAPFVVEVDTVLKCIKSILNGHLVVEMGGRCALSLVEFVASSPLTPLLNPDGGIHPIAFGVRVSSGADAILHSVNRVLNLRHGDDSLTMLTVDFSNAFNLVDRSALLRDVRLRCPCISLWVEFLYGEAARLYVGGGHIMSAYRVQQGDP
ncbi:hypothetical protein MTR_3g021185 [Medicago truncatula]|uniref:Reverse transcriptase domain-containing protein n=1 Tax=Medicago truncatula TaxID=3880 RepID=A0A072UVH1_MEDTR|nr:hypothetical protein MTR_3g021185 [Medicago truncatula]